MLSEDATYGKILPRIDDGRFDQNCGSVSNCALRQKINGNPNMAGVAANFSPAELEAVRLYLRNVRDAVVGGGPPAFANTGIGATADANISIPIENYRSTTMNTTLSVVSTVGNEFTLLSQSSSPGCAGGTLSAAASAASPATCTLTATLRFAPSASGTRTGNVHLALSVPSGLDPVPPARDFPLSAVSPPPIVATAIISSPPNNTSVVVGSTLTINGSTSTPVNGITAQWSVRDPANVTTPAGTATTQNVTFSTVGTYRVTLTVQPSGGGTQSSAFVDINVTAPPVVATAIISSPANNTSVVAGTTVTINGASSTPVNGVTYQWSVRDPANATTTAGTAATQNVTLAAVGSYRVTLTVQPSGGGTPSSAFIDIAVTPAPIIATAIISSPADNTSVVVGTTLTINGSTSTPLNGVTYQWSIRDPANVTTTAGSAATQSATFASTGTYRIALTVQPSGGGAQSSAFIDIAVTPPPVIPAPVYSPAGFDALSRFSASTAASQTLCPTIQNTGTAKLTLSFSAVQASGSSANFSNYFELGDNASCPATPRACNSAIAAGSPISGNTELMTPADGACTLALRFNPAKFGDAGGLGARSATLRISHNAPAGSVAEYPLIGNVTPRPLPSIGLSTNPAPVNGRILPPAFAAQPINTTSTLWNEFQVFNSGDADGLDLTEVTNSNPQEFTLTENCVNAPPLARPGTGTEASCVIGVRFTPKSLGEHCTTITVRAAVSSNGAQSPSVCGTGVPVPGPAIGLSSESIDFGRRFINAAYPPKPLVISNGAGATASLQINALTLAGSGFALVTASGASQPPCVGASLAPGASCTVQLQFAPDPARPKAAYSASLQVDTNDPTTPRRNVALAGVAGPVATPPVLQFPDAPAQIEFAAVVVAGRQSEQALTLTLRNAGPGNATIDAIRMVGADASSFSASGCSAVLEQGATCVVSVRFVPGSGGLKRAQLEILAASSIAPTLITVTGRGVGGTSAFLTTSVASVSLGSVRVGAQSAPIEVRLASAGDGVVQVTGLQADGPFIVKSKTCPGLPFTLPRGSDCTVTVTFAPTDARAAAGTLRISTDADPKALEVTLSASGDENPKVSSGGCSMASGDTLFDPTLWGLVLLAIGALAYRRRSRAASAPQRP